MGNNIFEKLTEKYPFITLCLYANVEYVGVVQNRDDVVTTIYDFGAVQTQEHKVLFLELASTWWWESNRTIPITIYMRAEMEPYRYAIKTMSTKDVDIVFGPTVNLNNIAIKRVKRKMIQLVKPGRR